MSSDKEKEEEKEIEDEPEELSELEVQLLALQKSIENLPEEKQKSMTKWIKRWKAYIDFEKRFKPHMNTKYEAGMLVQVNFGYNVGSEQGGIRPAVVIEDNDHSAKVVTVIPLSSLKSDKTIEDIESVGNVYLGIQEEYNKLFRQNEGTESIALMNQIRAISKMRISFPTKKNEDALMLDPYYLKKIYLQIEELYTRHGLDRESSVQVVEPTLTPITDVEEDVKNAEVTD